MTIRRGNLIQALILAIKVSQKKDERTYGKGRESAFTAGLKITRDALMNGEKIEVEGDPE